MNEWQQGLTGAGLAIRVLARWGDRTAFSGHGGSFTYAEALRTIARFQAVMHQAGVVQGRRIAFLNANRAEAWLANVAAQGLGLCVTSLHPLGSLEDHRFILDDGEIDESFVSFGVGVGLCRPGHILFYKLVVGPFWYRRAQHTLCYGVVSEKQLVAESRLDRF